MTVCNDTWRTIGWNSLTLSCPGRWETIVSGDTHLLFEEDFQPVLELRWQTQNKPPRKSTNTLLRRLQQGAELFPHQSIPSSWEPFKNSFTIQLLNEKGHALPKTALLTCKQCGTTLLFYLFSKLSIHHPDLVKLLSSLRCHGQPEQKILWSIQDFRVLLPDSFQLSSHSFAAGLTRISFVDSGLTMHLCRLASATQRLEAVPLTGLMNLLGDTSIPTESIWQTDHSVSHSNHPTIFKQIMSRLKRKAPFHWMILRHHPELDRLSGLFFFDKKPFSKKNISSILNSYELFPL